jgi:hypothetical protein
MAAAVLVLMLVGGAIVAMQLSGDGKGKPAAQAPAGRSEGPPPGTETSRSTPKRDTPPFGDKPDPIGTWKWTFGFGDKTSEHVLSLKMQGDKLSGTYLREGRETPVEDLKYQDGELSFRVSYMRGNGMKHHMRFEGKLTGDTIKGKIESGFGGRGWDWEAKRVKP